MRPIDADALDKLVYEEIPLKYFNGSLKTMSFVRELIEEAPTISPGEVRGVVHCKDCKFGEHSTDDNGNHCVLCENSMVFDYPYAHDPDWFCADGERMKGVSEDA